MACRIAPIRSPITTELSRLTPSFSTRLVHHRSYLYGNDRRAEQVIHDFDGRRLDCLFAAHLTNTRENPEVDILDRAVADQETHLVHGRPDE